MIPKPIVPPRRLAKTQKETIDQKAFVQALNLKFRDGFFYRVKNMGTYDAVRGFYRKNAELVAIPDICGYRSHKLAGNGGRLAQNVFIECKHVQKVEQKRKLCFKVKISNEQKDFLSSAYKSGCLAGVAFTLDDAISIAANDSIRHPRHPRTWCFLAGQEQEEKAEIWKKERAAKAALNQDPLGFISLREPAPGE